MLSLDRFHKLNDTWGHDKINQKESTSSEEKLIFYETIQYYGYNPFDDFIIFELISREGNETNPWIVFEKVKTKFFFRTKLIDNPPFHYAPGEGREETNVRVEYKDSSSNRAIIGTLIRKIHIEHFKKWLGKLKSKDEADKKLAELKKNRGGNISSSSSPSVDADGFSSYTIVDDDDNSVPPLTKEEIRDLRAFIYEWNKSVQESEIITEEVKEQVDLTLTKIDGEIAKKKGESKNKIGKLMKDGIAEGFQGAVSDEVKQELTKLGGKAIQHAPTIISWIVHWVKSLGS